MEDCYFVNPNINPNPYNYSAVNMAPPPSSEFVLSDYLMLDDHDQESWSHSTETESSEKDATHHGLIGDAAITSSNNNNIKCKSSGTKRNNGEMSGRITFRTRSQLEIMDDGYKWRKYGKKSVKNSPNPRNYYKCSSEGCGVKKRVERDREDWSYVLTSYEGVHNHESPYYAQMHSNILL